ncbi:MAG: membrane integrity-associated transporter subunit PqiC [Sphingomonadales bacterium]|nr:membrane integrity-associated transporter subunit PqiC [Sphingomonadales bacterium]
MSKHIGIKKIVAVLLLPMLVACGPLIEFPGSGDAPRHFQLTPSGVSLANSATANVSSATIYMESVSSSGVLKTTNILVQAGSNELQYYKDALWVDRTPILVERFLIEALASNGSLTVVGPESIEIPADYRLRIDLKGFSFKTGQIGSSDKVYISLTAMLVKNGPIEIMGLKEFNIERNVSSGEIDEVIEGFNIAMNGLSQDLSGWIYETLENEAS